MYFILSDILHLCYCSLSLSAGFRLQSHYNGYNLRQLVAVAETLAEFHAMGTALVLTDGEDGLGEHFPKLLKQTSSTTSNKSNGDSNESKDPAIAEHDLHGPFFKDFAKFLRRVPGKWVGRRAGTTNHFRAL